MKLSGAHIVTLGIEGIKAIPGSNTPQIKLRAAFNNGAASAVEGFARNLLDGQGISTADISILGLRFGLSRARSIEAFKDISVPLELPAPESGSSIDISKLAPWAKDLSLNSFNPSVKSVDISSVSDGINVGAGAELTNPTPLSLHVGYIAADFVLDGSRFVGAAVSDIKIVSGKQVATLALHLEIGNSQDLKKKVFCILTQVAVAFDRFSSSKSIQISVEGLEVGASSQDKITVLRGLRVPLQLPASGSISSIDISNLAPWAKDLSLDSFNPSVKSVDISTVPDGIYIGAGAELTNPTPISLRVGYIAAEVVLEGSKFVGAAVSDIKIVSGKQIATLGLHLSVGNTQDLKQKVLRSLTEVASAFKRVSAGQSVQIEIGGLEFGVSPQEKISVLGGVYVPVQVPLPGAASINSIDISKFAPWAKGLSLDSFSPLVKSLDISTVSDGINIATGVELINPTPISLRIGYIAADVVLGGSRFVGAIISNVNVAKGKHETVLSLHLTIGRAQELRQKV